MCWTGQPPVGADTQPVASWQTNALLLRRQQPNLIRRITQPRNVPIARLQSGRHRARTAGLRASATDLGVLPACASPSKLQWRRRGQNLQRHALKSHAAGHPAGLEYFVEEHAPSAKSRPGGGASSSSGRVRIPGGVASHVGPGVLRLASVPVKLSIVVWIRDAVSLGSRSHDMHAGRCIAVVRQVVPNRFAGLEGRCIARTQY